jgi:putative transposase
MRQQDLEPHRELTTDLHRDAHARIPHQQAPKTENDTLFPSSFTRARNVLAKVPTHAQAEVKAAFWEIFDDIDAPPGDQAVTQARRRAQAFAERYGKRYPAAVSCLTDTLPELTSFLRFPREHWHRIRHTNLIERPFGETRRRTKVIGRLPGERSCLSLVWAVLDRASRGWRGVTQTPAGVRLLQDLRRDLRLPPHRQPDKKEVARPPVTAAA